MTAFLASASEVFTWIMSQVSTIATTVTGEPMFLVPVLLGFAVAGIGVFKTLSH